jgi:hypothetical protein
MGLLEGRWTSFCGLEMEFMEFIEEIQISHATQATDICRYATEELAWKMGTAGELFAADSESQGASGSAWRERRAFRTLRNLGVSELQTGFQGPRGVSSRSRACGLTQ